MDQSDRIVVSICFGSHWAYCKRWAEHTRYKCDLPIHILSVDGMHLADDLGDGVFVHAVEIPSTSLRDAEIYRLEFIADKLASGISCAQMDMDVLLKREIADLFTIDADFIASRAFAFPDFMTTTFGFAACTGFFIAKPASAGLCAEIAKAMRDKRYGDGSDNQIDQYVLNKLFFDEIYAGAMKPFTLASPSAGPIGAPCSVSEYRGTKVCVLPTETILRGANLAKSTFGNHHPAVVSFFGQR